MFFLVQIQVIMRIYWKNILQIFNVKIWIKKHNVWSKSQEKGKKERKKNKKGGILCFSSANSTNYANFLEIVFKWKKTLYNWKKRTKMGFKKNLVQIQLIILLSYGGKIKLTKFFPCHKIEKAIKKFKRKLSKVLYYPTKRKKQRSKGIF